MLLTILTLQFVRLRRFSDKASSKPVNLFSDFKALRPDLFVVRLGNGLSLFLEFNDSLASRHNLRVSLVEGGPCGPE
jgi:hypothetical protein